MKTRALAPLTRRTLISGMGLTALGLALVACGSDEEKSYEAYMLADDGAQKEPKGEYADLAEALESLKTDSGAGELSLTVHCYETGEAFTFNPGYEGYEASTVKVPIALSVLRKAYDENKLIDGEVQDWLDASLNFSDNNATMALFGSLGQDVAAQDSEVNKTYERLGITRTQCVDGWGNNKTNTPDHAKIARVLYEGIEWVGAEDMRDIRNALSATDLESQGWGVGILANLAGSAGTQFVADSALCKNGWITDNTGVWYVSSTGAAQYKGQTYAISVMTTGFTEQEKARQLTSSAVEKVMEHLGG